MEFTNEDILRMVGQLAHFGAGTMDGRPIIPTNWFDMSKNDLKEFCNALMKKPMFRLSSGRLVVVLSDMRDAFFVSYAMASSGYDPSLRAAPRSLYYVAFEKASSDEKGENPHDLGE